MNTPDRIDSNLLFDGGPVGESATQHTHPE